MLGIKNILTRSELLGLFKILQEMKYIQITNEPEYEYKSDDYDENEDNHGDNKYFVLGPRCFIDLKNWIDSKTEDSGNECILCQCYVMVKGFKCGNDKCPALFHESCINGCFDAVNNGRYNCPACTNRVAMDNMEQIKDHVEVLSHPNDAIKIIEDMKARARRGGRDGKENIPIDDAKDSETGSDSD